MFGLFAWGWPRQEVFPGDGPSQALPGCKPEELFGLFSLEMSSRRSLVSVFRVSDFGLSGFRVLKYLYISITYIVYTYIYTYRKKF
jgi:hypothetical protein